jgi:hypothetical protein
VSRFAAPSVCSPLQFVSRFLLSPFPLVARLNSLNLMARRQLPTAEQLEEAAREPSPPADEPPPVDRNASPSAGEGDHRSPSPPPPADDTGVAPALSANVTPAVGSTIPRKRPARDLGQVVEEITRKVHIGDKGKQAVYAVMQVCTVLSLLFGSNTSSDPAQAEPQEREVWHVAVAQKTLETVEAIQPTTKGAWPMSAAVKVRTPSLPDRVLLTFLQVFIDTKSARLSLSTSTAVYLKDNYLTRIMMVSNHLSLFRSFHLYLQVLVEKEMFTLEIKDFKTNEAKRTTVRKYSNDKFTDRRHYIKKAVRDDPAQLRIPDIIVFRSTGLSELLLKTQMSAKAARASSRLLVCAARWSRMSRSRSTSKYSAVSPYSCVLSTVMIFWSSC